MGFLSRFPITLESPITELTKMLECNFLFGEIFSCEVVPLSVVLWFSQMEYCL